ncbi:hypothetical protein DH2020_049998 [Rehmannia glutinosa]|uniref:Large ribosomal subunit protein uL4m n=1 Tax=Rehmannia glutinosa TaxID=99300 RepID=A0ABR0U175_REHGL
MTNSGSAPVNNGIFKRTRPASVSKFILRFETSKRRPKGLPRVSFAFAGKKKKKKNLSFISLCISTLVFLFPDLSRLLRSIVTVMGIACLHYSLLYLERYSTMILTPNSSEGAFPSELLSSKRVLTPDREIGLYEDLVIPVTNFSNEDKGFMVLAGDVFDVPIRKDIIHRVVRWQLAKRQQGTHSTKTISEVSGTGRKPWQQKGTGRARHGTLRDKLNGQQFRGGAVMHGPKPRSHAIKLNKKVRRLGLKIALSARAAEGRQVQSTYRKDLEVPSHKTKHIVNYVHQMENAKKLLLVDGGPINEKLKLATQNIHYVNVLPSIGLNVYSILLHDMLVMSRDAVNKIVERMHTPINR